MDLRSKVIFGALCALFGTGTAFCQKVNLPDSKGKTELIHNCTACHSTDLIVRVRKTPEDWRKTVNDMADRGVDASDEDLATIIHYLSTNFGIESSTPTLPQSATSPAPPRSSGDAGSSGDRKREENCH